MNDTPETIRKQMDETKAQLSEKMESLEQQVTNTVQSTGAAVNATVGAVQETVETVTEAVQGATQSVSNALNLRLQTSKHPWLVIGGAFALGYLAHSLLTARAKKPELPPVLVVETPPANVVAEAVKPAVKNAATSAIVAAAYESGRSHSPSLATRSLAIEAMIGVVQAIAIHAVPHVIEYFASQRSGDSTIHPEGAGEEHDSPGTNESSDAAQHLRIASPEDIRSGNAL